MQFCVEDARRVPGAREPLGPIPNKARNFELRACATCGVRLERNKRNAGTAADPVAAAERPIVRADRVAATAGA